MGHGGQKPQFQALQKALLTLLSVTKLSPHSSFWINKHKPESPAYLSL